MSLLDRLLEAIHRPADRRICVRVNSELLALIQELAIKPNYYKSVSDFVVLAVASKLRELIEERERSHRIRTEA